MTKETDFLVQSLFQRENMDEMTLDELKAHTESFPYASILHFLYTSKLKTLYHLDFPEAVSKTALFFHEPQWLNYQLREDAERGNFRLGNYDLNYNDSNEDLPLPATTEEELPNDDSIDDAEEPALTINSTPDSEEPISTLDSTTASEELVSTIASTPAPEEPAFTIDLTPVSEEPVSTLDSTTAPEEPVLVFDPYHTVDYFASLGIKINLDNDKDELSRKVKSFTSWLKTMKRLQPGVEINTGKDIAAILDSSKKDEESSETIFTEAMAEVYMKQGLTSKAIEVYDKLSLQNPLNSHIFTDKISQIKANKV